MKLYVTESSTEMLPGNKEKDVLGEIDTSVVIADMIETFFFSRGLF